MNKDNSIKSFHASKGIVMLHICKKELKLKMLWNQLHDVIILMLRNFWVVYGQITNNDIESFFIRFLVSRIKSKVKL